MEATNKELFRFLGENERRFIIPVYQRNYDWKHEHCQQLFEDLMRIIKEKQESYFMGSIVSTSGVRRSELIIIDGQQRITTLSLMLLAIYHLLRRGEVVAEDERLADKIQKSYLIDEFRDDEKIRLKPAKNDNKAFEKLFLDDTSQRIKDSNITANYDYFETHIKAAVDNGKCTIDDFFEAFRKLVIVDIELHPEMGDNPHLIFESLNAAGKKLEEADLIRNFILMDKDAKTQEYLYENYWLPIEKNTNYWVSDFIKNFLTYHRGLAPRKDRIYQEFQRFVAEQSQDADHNLERILQQLKEFSTYYKQIVFSEVEEPDVRAGLKRINYLGMGVTYPYLLDLFHVWRAKGIVSEKEVCDILHHIETFVFRRLICEIPTNALNKVFPALVTKIRRTLKENDSESYLNCFLYFLVQGSGIARSPIDSEFMDKIQQRDIYNLKSKNRIHLFKRLEDFQNRESDIENSLAEGRLTFEHIMPQTLNRQWRESLGDNYLEIHEKYLNRLGNLTLTGYNPEYSNRPFIEKRNMKNGFKESTLWLNQDIGNVENWTEQEIKTRGKHLANRALEIWPTPPKSSYQPRTAEQVAINIFEDFNFTGTKPTQFTLLGESHSVKSWLDLYMQTAKKLDFLDTSYFERIATQPEKASLFCNAEDEIKSPKKLRDNSDIYLRTRLSADGIISNLKLLFDENGIDEEDFEVVLKED